MNSVVLSRSSGPALRQLPQVVTEDRRRLVEGGPDDRLAWQTAAQHADGLGPLTGEDEAQRTSVRFLRAQPRRGRDYSEPRRRGRSTDAPTPASAPYRCAFTITGPRPAENGSDPCAKLLVGKLGAEEGQRVSSRRAHPDADAAERSGRHDPVQGTRGSHVPLRRRIAEPQARVDRGQVAARDQYPPPCGVVAGEQHPQEHKSQRH